MERADAEIWVQWKGKRTGPYTPAEVDALIARRTISALHRLEINGAIQSVRDYVAAKTEAARVAKPRLRLVRTGADSAAEIDSSEGAADSPESSAAQERNGAEWPEAAMTGRLNDEFAYVAREVVSPVREFLRFQWLTQGRTALLLAVILPSVGLFLFMDTGGWGREWFWWLSGYFSVLWMILFGLILRPNRGAVWKAGTAFAVTALLSLAIWGLHSIPETGKTRQGFDPRDLNSTAEVRSSFQKLTSAAIPAELYKLLVVAALLVVFRKRLSVRDALYLGFASGLGLGIVEAIDYQARIDERMSLGRLDYYNSLALVRLIALPLLQAVWTAIAAYFLGLAAKQLPRVRYGLIGLALVVPMCLHAAYNNLGGWPALIPCTASVLILMVYTRESERSLPAIE